MDIQPRANRTTSAFDTWAAAHLGERHRREGVSNSATVPANLRSDYRAAWYGEPGEPDAAQAPAARRLSVFVPLAFAASVAGAVVCLLSACGVL